MLATKYHLGRGDIYTSSPPSSPPKSDICVSSYSGTAVFWRESESSLCRKWVARIRYACRNRIVDLCSQALVPLEV